MFAWKLLVFLQGENQTNVKSKHKKMKRILIIAALVLAVYLIARSCGGSNSSSQSVSSQWVGTYEQSPWKFVLRKDGSAMVRSSEDHEYETTWEDGGNWAVVGAYNGEVFLIDNNGNLSIMGKDGHKTGLFKLKKSK